MKENKLIQKLFNFKFCRVSLGLPRLDMNHLKAARADCSDMPFVECACIIAEAPKAFQRPVFI